MDAVCAAGRLVASLLQVAGAYRPALLRLCDRGTQTSIRAARTVDCDSGLGPRSELIRRERDRSSLCCVSLRQRQSVPLASTPHGADTGRRADHRSAPEIGSWADRLQLE